MRVNVEKRLLQLDLDMILDPYINRPGKQWWAGEQHGGPRKTYAHLLGR